MTHGAWCRMTHAPDILPISAQCPQRYIRNTPAAHLRYAGGTRCAPLNQRPLNQNRATENAPRWVIDANAEKETSKSEQSSPPPSTTSTAREQDKAKREAVDQMAQQDQRREGSKVGKSEGQDANRAKTLGSYVSAMTKNA